MPANSLEFVHLAREIDQARQAWASSRALRAAFRDDEEAFVDSRVATLGLHQSSAGEARSLRGDEYHFNRSENT